MSQPIRFKTARLQWSVQFDRRDHRTTATVSSQPLATGSPASDDGVSPQSFSITESDQDFLMEKIHSEIERRDGPVLNGDAGDDVD